MKLRLSDKTELSVIEYNTESDLRFVLSDTTIEDLKKVCTTENLATVQLVDTVNHMVYGEFNIDGSRETSIESSEQIIAEYYDRILGKEITLNTESNQITIHLQERTLADKVSELSDKLTQAQADIADDGYWGIAQTSQRLFDFASALAGDDVEKMQKMQQAMEKGFKQATAAWGKSLPEISQKTLEAANKLFEDYYKSKEAE